MKYKFLVIILFFLFIGLSPVEAKVDFNQIVKEYLPDTSKGLIYISKKEMSLTLFDPDGNVVVRYPMACGKEYGAKTNKGDFKTPEGVFQLQEIKDASDWGHDFKDGKGFIKHAYGPWFLRLKTGFEGIGIHGTHDPNSIGSRATEGCIRLKNDNLSSLKPLVTVGMTVIIGRDDTSLVTIGVAKDAKGSDLSKNKSINTSTNRAIATTKKSSIKKSKKFTEPLSKINKEIDPEFRITETGDFHPEVVGLVNSLYLM